MKKNAVTSVKSCDFSSIHQGPLLPVVLRQFEMIESRLCSVEFLYFSDC